MRKVLVVYYTRKNDRLKQVLLTDEKFRKFVTRIVLETRTPYVGHYLNIACKDAKKRCASRLAYVPRAVIDDVGKGQLGRLNQLLITPEEEKIISQIRLSVFPSWL